MTQRLSDLRINIRMLVAENTFGQAGIIITPDSAVRALEEARAVARGNDSPEPVLIGQVVCFSFYPLAENPTLPFYATAKLAEKDIHPLLMNTSTSAMMMVIAIAQAQRAEAVFTKAFDLPAAISPMDAGINVVQTSQTKPEV